MDRPEEYAGLVMFDARRQLKRRGGANASNVRVGGTALPDVQVRLFEEVHAAIRNRPMPNGVDDALESLEPRVIRRAAKAALGQVEELADPGQDPAEVHRVLKALTAIRAKASTRVAREASGHVDQVVAQSLEAAKAALERLYSQSADKARAVVDQARESLRRMTYPAISVEPLNRLSRLTKAEEFLRARHQVLRPDQLENVRVDLTNRARQLCDDTKGEVAAELAFASLKRLLRDLDNFLVELGSRGAEFDRRLGEIQSILEWRQRQAAKDQHVSRVSVTWVLEGPDEKQIFAGMMARARCSDVGALAQHVLDRFEAAVREAAPIKAPWRDAANDSFADLVRAMEPADLADVFLRVCEGALGPGQTLYEAIAKTGLPEVAKFLFNRSKPMCHLTGRDIEALRVRTHEEVIVRLPPPVGPRDPGIRSDLIAALSKLGECTFRDSKAGDPCVTVVRINLGWPIAIESDTRTLLYRYLQAGESCHPPHLIGILPESPKGDVIEAYRAFSRANSSFTGDVS